MRLDVRCIHAAIKGHQFAEYFGITHNQIREVVHLLFPAPLPNEFQIFVIADVAATHALEVGRLELAIDEGVAELLHEAGKHDEGNL